MKKAFLVLMMAPIVLGACSSVDTQCKGDVCATVYRNSGVIGDMFYTSVVTQDEKIVAVVGGSEPSPIIPVVSAGIISGGIIRGGKALAGGMATTIEVVPPMLP